MGKRKILIPAVLLCLVVLFCGGSSDKPNVQKGPKYHVVKVKKVIDGDTVLLENGERVRYIGVDTPELKDSRKAVRDFAKRAKEANRRMVDKKEIRLEFDVQTRDRYKRLLAYVYVDTVFVNAWLVENGFAKVMTVPPNVKYANRFEKLQKDARSRRKGLWREIR